MITRIYKVSHDTGENYLVEAATPAQALRHVTAGQFAVRVATPKDVARLIAEGVELETAGEEQGAA